MKHINVVCAVVLHEGQILCMQRPFRGSASTAGKWEFPSGKIEEWTDEDGTVVRESPEDALRRELCEMDYEVEILRKIMTVEHQYPDFSLSPSLSLQSWHARIQPQGTQRPPLASARRISNA